MLRRLNDGGGRSDVYFLSDAQRPCQTLRLAGAIRHEGGRPFACEGAQRFGSGLPLSFEIQRRTPVPAKLEFNPTRQASSTTSQDLPLTFRRCRRKWSCLRWVTLTGFEPENSHPGQNRSSALSACGLEVSVFWCFLGSGKLWPVAARPPSCFFMPWARTPGGASGCSSDYSDSVRSDTSPRAWRKEAERVGSRPPRYPGLFFAVWRGRVFSVWYGRRFLTE